MISVAYDSSWPPALKKIHAEHQQFQDRSVAPNIYSWYQQRLSFLAEQMAAFAPAARSVLDIGCAQGSLAIYLAERGFDVVANDIRDSYLQYAKLRDDRHCVEWQLGNFLELDYRERFDVVFFTEVIEHLIEHDEFLAKIRQSLKPGGVLIVTTPNQEYFYERLPSVAEVDLGANKAREFSAGGEDHFYLFRKAELIDVIDRNGMSVLQHRYFLPVLQSGPMKLRLLWKVLPMQLMEALSRPLDGIKSLCAQQCVVARRPI